MSATFYAATVFEDENLVRSTDGGQAMRDNERGTAAHQMLKGLHQVGLSLRVYGGCRFIEN